ncbi:MAG: hypothetical protein WB493_16955 [Anaeromyxobacteraceae bacterium]
MRKIALIAVAAFAAACGGSTNNDPPPASGITGTVNGSSFQSVDQTALFGTANACSLGLAGGLAVGLNLAVVNVSDVTGTCAAATTCAFKSNSATLTVLIARADLANTTAPAIATGSYTFLDIARLLNDPTYIPPIPPGTDLKIFAATVTDLAATTCSPTPIVVTGGSLNVASSSTAGINGTVNVTLAGGGTLSGTIAATTCVPNFDACAALNAALTPGASGLSFCSGTPTCVP